jgi:hypothetical protein
VVGAAFMLAVFGWGMGFYGPPVYLHAVQAARGWPLPLISTAVTMHFVIGAIVVANLPMMHRRFGVATVTKAGALLAGVGVFGWAVATAPWQLFVASALSGAGWAAMGAAAINAIVAPWFVHTRPAALAMAYNGASIGGVVFSPLWVVAIEAVGFPLAAAAVGLVVTLATWALAGLMLSRTPGEMGLRPDGDPPGTPIVSTASASAPLRSGPRLWRDLTFLTLAAAMAVGLFAQIGLIAHLFSLLVPALGVQQAGLAMGLATASAIVGRTVVGWLMPAGADRRLVACASYAVQIAGCVAFMLAAGSSVPLLYAGIVLFGAGIGNATSLPPLIVQMEFVEHEVARVVALIVAIAQGTYAFAPLAFGLIRELAPQAAAGSSATGVFAAAALLQGFAICALTAGRRRRCYRRGKR